MLATFNERGITDIFGAHEDTPLVNIDAELPINKTGQLSSDRPTVVRNVKFGSTVSVHAGELGAVTSSKWEPKENVTEITNPWK
jgi:hypothetical protein